MRLDRHGVVIAIATAVAFDGRDGIAACGTRAITAAPASPIALAAPGVSQGTGLLALPSHSSAYHRVTGTIGCSLDRPRLDGGAFLGC
jgi:hypothetical protein